MYDRHPGSAGFFSPSPWGKYLCLRGSKQGTRIPIYCWKLTFLQGNDPQPFLLESQLSLSPPLSLIYSLSPLSSCVYSSLSFLDLPTGTVPFTEKGRESISIAAYRGFEQTLWPMAAGTESATS